MNNKFIFTGSKELQYYNDVLIRADLGLHKQVAEKVREILPAGGKVLDLGCGQGAMSLRLKELGYDVTAVDIDPEDFKCEGIPYICIDFNKQNERDEFIDKYEGFFDLVIGLEVIEHVENHWDYIRLLKTLVKTQGWILISTPNITSWLSRFNFLFFGQFHQFSDADLSYGHISPVTSWHLQHILSTEKMTNINIEPAGTLPPFYFNSVSITSLIYNAMNIIFYPFMRRVKKGWCIIATAKKEEY